MEFDIVDQSKRSSPSDRDALKAVLAILAIAWALFGTIIGMALIVRAVF